MQVRDQTILTFQCIPVYDIIQCYIVMHLQRCKLVQKLYSSTIGDGSLVSKLHVGAHATFIILSKVPFTMVTLNKTSFIPSTICMLCELGLVLSSPSTSMANGLKWLIQIVEHTSKDETY